MTQTVEASSVTLEGLGYFDLDFYQRVDELVAGWRSLGEVPSARLPTQDDRQACERLLALEARLIDAGRLEEWLSLYTADCAYWIPADVDGSASSRTVTWEFNDRRRLEERVERLATGRAFSQIPPTRTAHLYSNIEVMTGANNTMEVLCNFLIQTVRDGRTTQRAGWNGFVLRRTPEGWRIVLKRINLYDADLPQDNNSFTL